MNPFSTFFKISNLKISNFSVFISTFSIYTFFVSAFFVFTFFSANTIFAQSKKLKKQYESAKSAFQAQKYGEASTIFQLILLSKDKKANIIFQNSHYYLGLIYLQNKELGNAQTKLKEFLQKCNETSAKNEALFHLANISFQLFEQEKNTQYITDAYNYLSAIQDQSFETQIYQMKGNYLQKLTKNELKPIVESQKESKKDSLINKIYLHKWASELENIEDLRKMEVFAKNNNLQVPEKRKILGEKFKRNQYRVAMILPFEHEKIKKRDCTAVAKISFQMYQGMRLAQNDINKDTTSNMPKMELLAYEINKDQNQKLDDLLKSPEIKEADVVIGSLYDNFFVKIANQLQTEKNHIVHPITVQDSILKSNFTYSYYPTQSIMMQKVAEFAHSKIPLKTTIILCDNLQKNKQLATFYQRSCEKLGITVLIFEQINVTEKEKIGQILEKQKSNSTNIGSILLITTAQGLALELMKKMESLGINVPIFAPDTWLRFQDLSFEQLEKNKVRFFQHDYANYESEEARKFRVKFANFSRQEPTQYAYMGYEMAYFWHNVLRSFGTKRDLSSDFSKYPIQKGVITPAIDFQNGKNNQSILILRLDKDNKLVVAEE